MNRTAKTVKYTPLSILALFLSLPAAAVGADISAGAGGDYATIQEAIDAATSGDAIVIADGMYNENIVIESTAGSLANLALRAADGANVVIKPAAGNAVTVQGDFGSGSVVTIEGIAFEDGVIGVHVAAGTNLGELALTDAAFANNIRWGVMVGDGDYASGPATSLGKLIVSEATFTMSGATHPYNQGAGIKLWRFQGDASITNSAFTGGADAESASPANAIEMQGVDNENLADVAIGNVTLENVTVTGHYTKNPVGVFNYTDLENLAINGLDLSGATSGWYLFNIDGAKLLLDASGYDITWPEGHLPVAELQGEKDGSNDATWITGGAANEILNGKGGADTLEGGAGNDLLVGGEGDDVAKFSGNRADYLIGIDRINSVDGDPPTVFWTVVDQRDGTPDGVDKLLGVETLDFGDGPVELSSLDETGLFIVDAEGNGDIDSLQAALDAAQDGDTILVRPGVYEEITGIGSRAQGLAIEKSVTILGVNADNQPITARDDIAATIRSLRESTSSGTNFLVQASDVYIRGLRFEARADYSPNDPECPVPGVINKAFEIVKGGFTLRDSVVAAADGAHFNCKTSTSLYFNDVEPFVAYVDDLESFHVEGNVLEGGITISNGAGDTADRGANFTIVDNVSSGSYFLRVRGQVISERISWLEYHAGLPATVRGNDLTGVSGYLLQSWDSDPNWLADLDFIEALAANNIIGPYAYLLDADGNIGTIDYTEYETTVPAVFVYRTEGDFAEVPTGHTVLEGDTHDLDEDGTADFMDDDIDGDGIPNVDEGNGDLDGDGMSNDRDTDADGDGVADADEAGDLDADGVPDALELDEDGDGIPDVLEGWMDDSDSDGTINRRDLDSDNDGVPDAVELGDLTIDTDSDGIADLFDVDATGGVDANGDGIDDAVLPDSDGDVRNDLVDPDQDGDGVPDFIEAGGLRLATPDDELGKRGAIIASKPGITKPLDSDADGIPDVRDLDSDGDGVADSVEANVSGEDKNGNGIDDKFDVAYTGGIDDDGNGIPDDIVEQDSDGDGIPDSIDLDSDNDGIPDVVESGGLDLDGDGLLDKGGKIITKVPDADGDGKPDHLDEDSDGDGVMDIAGTPAARWDRDGDGRIDIEFLKDDDGDGIPDVIDGETGQHGSRVDTDNDGVAAHLDGDDDNDGLSDAAEGADDIDDDGAINRLDRDSDNDGIIDRIEAGFPAPTGTDADGDGIDDAWDADATGGKDADDDGIDDAFKPRNTDGDKTPDHLDTDSDGDGLLDAYEVGRAKLSGADSDGDGIDDALDVDATGGVDADSDGVDDAKVKVVDTDGDGKPNHLDTDSDGDGIADGDEDRDANGDGINDRLQEGPGNDDGDQPEPPPAGGGGGGGGSTGGFLVALLGLVAARRRMKSAA